MWCSFAVNLFVVINGRARDFMLENYGGEIRGWAWHPLQYGAPFPIKVFGALASRIFELLHSDL